MGDPQDIWGLIKEYGFLFGGIIGLFGLLFAAHRSIMKNILDVRLQRLSRIDDVNKSYIEFQRLCLENLDAPASVYSGLNIDEMSAAQKTKLFLMFDILTSIFERAYLAVYKDGPADQKESQWPGWELFMREYAGREDYSSWWWSNVASNRHDVTPQYDMGFQLHMTALLKSLQKSTPDKTHFGALSRLRHLVAR